MDRIGGSCCRARCIRLSVSVSCGDRPGIVGKFGLDALSVGTLVGLYMIPGLVLAIPGGMLSKRAVSRVQQHQLTISFIREVAIQR
jgi:hypothetical protein